MAISDEVARDGLAAVSVAAVMLIEDSIDQLVTRSPGSGPEQGRDADLDIASMLTRLGADLSALAGAAAVFARRD